MGNKNESYINIIYDINKTEEDTIKIFGKEFVRKNKDKCKMKINFREYEIKEEYYVQKYSNKKLIIKLKGIENVTNMSFIFMDVQHYYLYLIFRN